MSDKNKIARLRERYGQVLLGKAPGGYLDRRIYDKRMKIFDICLWIAATSGGSVFALVAFLSFAIPWGLFVWSVLWLCATALCFAFGFWRIQRISGQIRNHKLGREGERLVSLSLTEDIARANGKIYSDIPRHEGGNIDHVVVGPFGVFMLETKTWSGNFSRIEYDGKAISKIFPNQGSPFSDENPIRQARRNAAWLSGKIRDITGDVQWAQPVVVLVLVDSEKIIKKIRKDEARPVVEVKALRGLSSFLTSQEGKIPPAKAEKYQRAVEQILKDARAEKGGEGKERPRQ